MDNVQSTYAVYGSHLHLILSDEFAENYNAAQRAFFEAQKLHKARTGSEWTGHETIEINWTTEMRDAFNKFAELMNLMIEINGGSLALMEDDMTSDYLVKVE